MSFGGAHIFLSELLSNWIMGLLERILDVGFPRLREVRAMERQQRIHRTAAFHGIFLKESEDRKDECPLRNFPGTVSTITHPGRDDFPSLIIAEESSYAPLS